MEENKVNHSYEKNDGKLIKVMTSKDKYGVVRTYKYDQGQYMKKYHTKHHDDLRERMDCVCGKPYSKWNASHHLKTKYHLKRCNTIDNTPISNV